MSWKIRRHRPAPRGEAGSAYMIVMAALAVLTLVGLALIAVTTSEFQIGGAERISNRVFYAADSGIGVAIGRALVGGAYGSASFTVPDSPGGSLLTSKNIVSQSPFYPINDQPCNLCEINDTGEYNTHSYRKINYAVTVTAKRQATPLLIPGATPTTVAQKQIAAMVEIQPRQSSTDAQAAASDPTQLALIKF
jgi:hypothetical protein